MQRIVLKLVFCITVVLCLTASVYAASGVSIEIGPPKTAKPGDLITHVFTIKNTGTNADQYNLKITLPAGWVALPIPSQVSLAVGETSQVFLTVIVPGKATAGSYNVVLRATSTTNPSIWAEAEGVIEAVSTVGLELEAFKIARAPPGTEARHIIRVRNTGNMADTYRIEVTISKDWPLRAVHGQIQVLPGDQGEFTTAVLVPYRALPGSRYDLWFEVTSAIDPTITQTLMITATVVPPPPEKVRIQLYPEIPVTIRMNLTGEGNPKFGLSLAGELPGIGHLDISRLFGVSGMLDQGAGFHTSKLGVDWGSVSVSGAFAKLSGEGLRFLWDGMEIGGAELLLTDVGKGFAVSWEWEKGRLRLVSVGVEDALRYGVNEIQFSGTLSDTFSLAAILASANTQSGPSSAFQVKPSIRNDLVSGHIELAKVSPGFPEKPESNTFGWGLSFGATGSSLTGGFSIIRDETLTDAGPPQVFTADHGFHATASILLNPQMSVTLSLGLEGKESDDIPKTTEEGSSTASIIVSPGVNRTGWSLGASFKHTWDDVAGMGFLATGLELSEELSVGQIAVSSTLGLDLIRDLVTGTVSDTSSSFSLRCAFPQGLLSPTIELSVNNGRASLATDFSWSEVTGLSFHASFDLPLTSEGGFSAAVEFTFPVSIPFFGPTYGVIQGRTFIDSNKNGILDVGEKGAPGVLLTANGQQAITGSSGRFVFSLLLPGIYQIAIAQLPVGLSPLIEPSTQVKLKVGQVVELPPIPMESKSRISGFVFHDLNQNKTRDPGEPGVAGVQLAIHNAIFQKRITTDSSGGFVVQVPPGTYTVELVQSTLPNRFEPTTPTRVQVLVKEMAFVRAQFGVYQHPRQLIFAPQAPIARFNYTPSLATVGQRITFDALTSEAVEGKIVFYNWEFRKGSRVLKADGQQVSVIFEEAGTWLVTLEVTDSNGRTSQVQGIIMVQ